MRIAKKKNGKPNTDYPSKYNSKLTVSLFRGGPVLTNNRHWIHRFLPHVHGWRPYEHAWPEYKE